MSDKVIRAGDFAVFNIDCFIKSGVQLIGPLAGVMQGSCITNTKKKPFCLVGDEKKIAMPWSYTASGFDIPGNGDLTIDRLGDNQLSKVAKGKEGKAFILKGSGFIAKFTPSVPAMNVVGVPAPTAPYFGEGHFELADPKFFVQFA